MTRPRDQEETAINSLLLSDPSKRGHTITQGPYGSSRLGQKGELGVGRKPGQEPLLWFPQEGKRGLGMVL